MIEIFIDNTLNVQFYYLEEFYSKIRMALLQNINLQMT